jgi:hypothetical protein
MIFSTVTSLVETVGRTRSETFAELDTLTAIWTGPTTLADTVPKIGSIHPEYPNMELRATHKLADVAGITRIQLDYVGLFNNNSIGTVGKGFTTQMGELQYQQPFSVRTGADILQSSNLNQFGQPAPGPSPFNLYGMKYGLQTFIVTYISRSSTYRYCCKNAQTPRFSGGTILSTSQRPGGQSSITYGFVGPGGAGPTPDQLYPGVTFGSYFEQTFCSSFNAEPISPSWFRCTEVWSARLVAAGG